MAAAMRDQHAVLGGGPSGRYWHAVGRLPLPDALRTLTLLLVLLSRDDRPAVGSARRCRSGGIE